MTRTISTLAFVSLFTYGCARSQQPEPRAMADRPAVPAADQVRDLYRAATAAGKARPRAPGDFVVYRFSGRLKSQPLSLTERLVAYEGDLIVMDFTLRDVNTTQTMRVRMAGEGAEQKVVSAALMEGDLEASVSTEAFDALIARTVVAADGNDGMVDQKEATVDVGGRGILCTKTTYRVTVAKHDAMLTVLHSDAFPWGDVGGEIRAKNGALLYKAELVAKGSAQDSAQIVAERTLP